MSEILHPGINLGAAHGIAHRDAERVVFGFWVFLMSDLILFGMLFASYAAMHDATAGGPGPATLFNLGSVAMQTALLLASSLTYGFASLALKHGTGRRALVGWLLVTGALGLGFLGFELRDFADMVAKGGIPQRSGWLSALFSLVGLHGIHVFIGLCWIMVMLVQLRLHGLTSVTKTRLLLLGLYWHFLDLIWVGIFSLVFLVGTT